MMRRIFELTESEFCTLMQRLLNNVPKHEPVQEKKEVEKDTIKIKEAADLLGYKVGYIYQLKTKSKIPFKNTKSGGLRFSKKELMAWMHAGRPDMIEAAIKTLLK